MKRSVAFLLCAILMLSCLPIVSAGAKDVGVETKFRMLLEDMELVQNVHRSDRYFFEQIGQYPAKDPEWILIRGGLYDLSANGNIQYQYAAFGNKFLRANTNSSPFSLGYGVFDVKTNVFYDLVDAWDMNLNNLREVWDELAPAEPYDEKDKSSENGMYVIGDADADGEVTVLDATRIQRCLAELDTNPWEDFSPTGDDFVRGTVVAGATDYDRDGDTTVMDATRIQRNVAELPNVLDYRLAWDEHYSPDYYAQFRQSVLINSLDELDLSDSRFAKDVNDPDFDAEKKIRDAYDDSFFTDKSLLLADISLGSNTYHLTLEKLSIDSEGTLNVDFSLNNPMFSDDTGNDRFIAIELSKAFIDDIRDIRIIIDGRTVPSYGYRLAKHPYLAVDTGQSEAKIFTSRDQLDPALEGHRQLMDDYDESFFKNNAILAVSYWLPSGSMLEQFVTISFYDTVEVFIDEYRPVIGTSDIRPVNYCFEVSKDALSNTDGKVKVIHNKIDNKPNVSGSMVYNNDVSLDRAVGISGDYEDVWFSDPYYATLNTTDWDGEGVYSSLLIEARGEKNSSVTPFDPKGVAGIITNPIDLENMIHDDKMSTGYFGNGFWWYELDKTYQYDLKFFDQYALVAVSQQGHCYESLSIKGLYKKDGTLYIDAELWSATVAAPEEIDCLTLVRVDKSLIADVTAVELGYRADVPYEEVFTDDKKISDTRGDRIAFDNLSTCTKEFDRDRLRSGDVEAFLNQPYRVAVITNMAQFNRYFSDEYFENINQYADYETIHDLNEMGLRKEIDDRFFEENVMIVGAGFFDTEVEAIDFKDIRIDSNFGYPNMFVRFNHYIPEDYSPDPDASQLLFYSFAAAKVPKDRIGKIYDICMMPQVEIKI